MQSISSCSSSISYSCGATSMEETPITVAGGAENALREAMEGLLSRGDCSDVLLRCGLWQTRVHRAVLCAWSPVLRTLLVDLERQHDGSTASPPNDHALAVPETNSHKLATVSKKSQAPALAWYCKMDFNGPDCNELSQPLHSDVRSLKDVNPLTIVVELNEALLRLGEESTKSVDGQAEDCTHAKASTTADTIMDLFVRYLYSGQAQLTGTPDGRALMNLAKALQMGPLYGSCLTFSQQEQHAPQQPLQHVEKSEQQPQQQQTLLVSTRRTARSTKQVLPAENTIEDNKPTTEKRSLRGSSERRVPARYRSDDIELYHPADHVWEHAQELRKKKVAKKRKASTSAGLKINSKRRALDTEKSLASTSGGTSSRRRNSAPTPTSSIASLSSDAPPLETVKKAEPLKQERVEEDPGTEEEYQLEDDEGTDKGEPQEADKEKGQLISPERLNEDRQGIQQKDQEDPQIMPEAEEDQGAGVDRHPKGENCHHCKTRKKKWVGCPLVPTHRFCDRCVGRHFGNSLEAMKRQAPVLWSQGCPACLTSCPCASCTRKRVRAAIVAAGPFKPSLPSPPVSPPVSPPSPAVSSPRSHIHLPSLRTPFQNPPVPAIFSSLPLLHAINKTSSTSLQVPLAVPSSLSTSTASSAQSPPPEGEAGSSASRGKTQKRREPSVAVKHDMQTRSKKAKQDSQLGGAEEQKKKELKEKVEKEVQRETVKGKDKGGKAKAKRNSKSSTKGKVKGKGGVKNKDGKAGEEAVNGSGSRRPKGGRSAEAPRMPAENICLPMDAEPEAFLGLLRAGNALTIRYGSSTSSIKKSPPKTQKTK